MDKRTISSVDMGLHMGTILWGLLESPYRIHVFWLTRKLDRSSYEDHPDKNNPDKDTNSWHAGVGQSCGHLGLLIVLSNFLGALFRRRLIWSICPGHFVLMLFLTCRRPVRSSVTRLPSLPAPLPRNGLARCICPPAKAEQGLDMTYIYIIVHV